MRELPNFDINQLRLLIQRRYGIQVLEITPFRRVFILETNLGKRFFKPFDLGLDKMQLIADAKEHLLNQGFTQLIPFVKTLSDKPYCRYGQQIFYMTQWVDGHPCNYDNPFELRVATQLFANFHQAAKGFVPPLEMPSHLGKWEAIFKERQQDLLRCRDHALTLRDSSLFELLFIDQSDFYLAETERSLGLLRESTYNVMCQQGLKDLPFCHHDPAHHNILITTNNQPLLIDFDYLLQDLHLHDLASLLIRNGKSSGWNLKRCQYLLKAYQEIQPLTPEELAVVRAFIAFPFEIWFLAYAKYIEKRKWPLKYYLKEWERKTRDEDKRQVFLEEFMELVEV